jgi:hypothetical protein
LSGPYPMPDHRVRQAIHRSRFHQLVSRSVQRGRITERHISARLAQGDVSATNGGGLLSERDQGDQWTRELARGETLHQSRRSSSHGTRGDQSAAGRIVNRCYKLWVPKLQTNGYVIEYTRAQKEEGERAGIRTRDLLIKSYTP